MAIDTAAAVVVVLPAEVVLLVVVVLPVVAVVWVAVPAGYMYYAVVELLVQQFQI